MKVIFHLHLPPNSPVMSRSSMKLWSGYFQSYSCLIAFNSALTYSRSSLVNLHVASGGEERGG